MLRESLITEVLTNVDGDVNLIYDKFFKKDIDEIDRTGFVTKNMFKIDEWNTYMLKTPISLEANKKNACTIIINEEMGNFYSPRPRVIGFGINRNALDYVINYFNGDVNKASLTQPEEILISEFTEEKM